MHGASLALVAALWIVCRILPFIPGEGTLVIWLSAFLECTFWGILAVKLTQNVAAKKQWNQMAIIGKLWLFVPAVLVFHLGLLGVWNLGVTVGLYSGFWLVLALILTMARRVMPMFVERGLNNGFVPKNSKAVDRWSMVLCLIFAILEVIAQVNYNSNLRLACGILAAAQALLHFYRLSLWHHAAVWRHPLLMSVFAGYAFFIVGFALEACNMFGAPWLTTSIAMHAFAVGGIGLFAFGMMARIALGHTGRSVYEPPRFLSVVFWAFVAAAILRVFWVMIFPEESKTWILSAQGFWMAGAVLFCVLYVKMLVLARVDGSWG